MVALLLLDKSSLCQNNRATKTRHNYSRWQRAGNLKTKICDSEIRYCKYYILRFKVILWLEWRFPLRKLALEIFIQQIFVMITCSSDLISIGVYCSMYTGPCSEGGGSDKEPDVKSASSMNVMPCKAYTCAEVETHLDNDLDLEDDKNSEEGEVKEVCDMFGQQIGVATQKRENTSEREQEARAFLDQEKCMQLKSKLF